jgi:hypothetical protein
VLGGICLEAGETSSNECSASPESAAFSASSSFSAMTVYTRDTSALTSLFLEFACVKAFGKLDEYTRYHIPGARSQVSSEGKVIFSNCCCSCNPQLRIVNQSSESVNFRGLCICANYTWCISSANNFGSRANPAKSLALYQCIWLSIDSNFHLAYRSRILCNFDAAFWSSLEFESAEDVMRDIETISDIRVPACYSVRCQRCPPLALFSLHAHSNFQR